MPHPALSKDTIIKFTGGEDLETLQSNDMLARMSLAAVKTPGVAEVFEYLLGFEGDEFYTKVGYIRKRDN